jgi:hypothetical protein
MNKRKAGRPKVKPSEKIVPLSLGVPAQYKKELLAKFKQIANEYKLCSSLNK